MNSNQNISEQNDRQGYSTNRILYSENPTEDIYFIPAYIRLKCKQFTNLDIKNMQGVVNCTIKIAIFYGDLNQQIVGSIKKDLVLETSRGDPIALKQSISISTSQNSTQKIINFEVNKYMKCKMDPHIFWTPFEILNMILTVNLRPLSGQANGKRFTARFNFMDHQDNFQKISYTKDCTFGQHDLAQTLLKVQYSNQRIPKQEQTQLLRLQRKVKIQKKRLPENNQMQVYKEKHSPIKTLNIIQNQKSNTEQRIELTENTDQKQFFIKRLRSFEYAHFIMPLYKFPFVSLLTVYLPLWYISVILLGNFFVANIIVVANRMVAFAALLPLIRGQIATSPSVTFTQILIYVQSAFACFMCLANLVQVSFNKYPRFPLDYVWQENAFFIISASVTLTTIVIVTIQLLYHWIVLQPSYHSKVSQPKNFEFNPWEWKNEKCDEYFKDKRLLPISNCQNPYQSKQNLNSIKNLYYQNKLLAYHED